MNILDFYKSSEKQDELKALLVLGAQKHPAGLAANFLEKDLWVTEILRLLYEERLIGDFSIAFKGGTALSKCWKVIERFSEDIDLSIHWVDLAGADDEVEAWEKTTKNPSQRKKFQKRQKKLLIEWSQGLVDRLNERFSSYEIDGLIAELEADSEGEKIDIHFPRVTAGGADYQLDYILLEFGGRNRGHPTESKPIDCYLSEIPEFSELEFPTATVQAYHPAYVVWEKLTALHQFSTQSREPNSNRLARHWYDVDCILQKKLYDPLGSHDAMTHVVEMKRQRWHVPGVSFDLVLSGGMQLIPEAERLAAIASDHQEAVKGGMFFSEPDSFDVIVGRIKTAQDHINMMLNSGR